MKTNYEKAFELVRAHIAEQVNVDSSLYGLESKNVRESIINDKAHAYVKANGAEAILSHQLKLDLTEMLDESGIDYFSRVTPHGVRFTIMGEEDLSIVLEADKMKVLSGQIVIVDDILSIGDLMEAVDLDMRTKRFKETIKRRCGEKYCKTSEKVDMRTRPFKSAIKRAEERKRKREEIAQRELEEKTTKKRPPADYNEIFRKHIMKESRLQEAGVNKSEQTNAAIVADVLENIFSLIEEPEDFTKLLKAIKAAGLNPLPIKHELEADAERIYALRHTNKDIAYIIANIKKISDIALAVLDKEEEKDEGDAENGKEPEEKDNVSSSDETDNENNDSKDGGDGSDKRGKEGDKRDVKEEKRSPFKSFIKESSGAKDLYRRRKEEGRKEVETFAESMIRREGIDAYKSFIDKKAKEMKSILSEKKRIDLMFSPVAASGVNLKNELNKLMSNYIEMEITILYEVWRKWK